MLETFRDNLADIFAIISDRLTTEPRRSGSRIGGSARTVAGVIVTPDQAVTIPTVWACLRYLSQTVAVLPWHVMKNGDEGAAIQPRHACDYLLHERASDEWSSFQFRETLLHWALRWGNGYAEIERDQFDRPYALWPIHPDRVDVCRGSENSVDDYGTPILKGQLFYEVSNGTDGKTVLAAKNVFHLRGFGEGPVGVNVIQYAAQSLGWAKAAQLFGASFFGNGATPTTVVKNKKGLTPAGLRKQKAEFEALYKGPSRAHRTAHLDNDAEISTISLDAEKSQLIETHQYLVAEICRWFGVPPHKVANLDRATFSNIESQSIEVVVDSISPWVKRFEDEANFKFFGRVNRGLYTKMNMRALMRGDAKSRAEYYKLMREAGAYSPNRILELEDENTIGPAGDIHTMNSTYTTIERIADGTVPAGGNLPAESEPAENS